MRMYVDDFEVRAAAARELGAMGGEAAAALPELVRCAATEPREGGSRDGDLDPGHLADSEPVADCAEAIAAIGAENPKALVAALAIPLEIKERAVASLARAGKAAVPGVTAVYLDACTRGSGATDPAVRRNLDGTAAAALAVLASHRELAVEALGATGSACAVRGADRLRAVAETR